MSSRTFLTSWPLLAAAVGVAVLAAVAGAGRGLAGTDCLYGQITMSSRPLLSAPSPAQGGDTITSSGGGWAVCGGEGINGFNKEWLRDGTVVSGPDWVAGWPDSFTYTIQAADVGSYPLRASPDGLTDADGWVNFAVEGTAGDVPYYAVATRQWNGSDWLSADQADTPAIDPSYPVLPEDVDLDPQGGSIANGD